MKDLNRSARTLNAVLNGFFWLMAASGLFSAGYHGHAVYKLLTDPAALTEQMGLTIDWLTITADHGFGIGLDAAVSMKLVLLISAVVITVIICRGIQVLKRVLLPIEVDQPFRRGISGNLSKLSKYTFWLGMAENLSGLLQTIIIENHYALPTLLTGDTVTRVTIARGFDPTWFIVTGVISVLAIVFRRGEELQTLADETL